MSILDYKNLNNEQRQTNRTIATIEASAAHAAMLEAEQTAFAEQQKRDAESEKLAEQHRQEREKELQAEAEKLRLESNKNLEVQIRERFFRANPNALESDFQRVKDRLKDDYFIEQMKAEQTAEEIIKGSGNYNLM